MANVVQQQLTYSKANVNMKQQQQEQQFIKVLFGLLALSASVQSARVHSLVAVANPTGNVNFGQGLKMFYEAVQRILPCGYAPYNLPVLAPYTIDQWNFDFSSADYSLVGNLSNTVITGMNKFRVLKSHFDESKQRYSFDIVFSKIQILGSYEFNAYALLAGFPAYGAGQGLLNMKFVDLRYVGAFTIKPSQMNGNGVAISDFNLNFYFGNIENNNWNNLWDISGNNFANRWARDFALMWTEQIQVQVDAICDTLMLPRINDLLHNISLTEIINFFVMAAQKLNTVTCNAA